MATVTKNIILRFSPDTVDQPFVYRLVKDYDLIPNIIRASIDQGKQGYTLLSLTGESENYAAAYEYLCAQGLQVQSLGDRVKWDEDTCTQCGACTALCPSQALVMLRPEMKISFDCEKCVVCHMCIEACPVKAVKLDF